MNQDANNEPGWWKRMTVRLAQLDQYIRGDRWRPLVRWLYKLIAPFYDWGADRLMPDYRQAAVHLLDELAVTRVSCLSPASRSALLSPALCCSI
ncbi:MAG TPA: hypothetical protein VF177_20410 [Anaerolineae bacterium]